MTYWIGVLLATIGASLILGALTFVSALIGGGGQRDDRADVRPDHRPRRLAGEAARRPGRPLTSRSASGASGVVAERSGGLVVDLETSQQLPQSSHLHLQAPAPTGHRGHEAGRVREAGAC